MGAEDLSKDESYASLCMCKFKYKMKNYLITGCKFKCNVKI